MFSLVMGLRLWGHGAGALLLWRKELFSLAYLGALQVADLRGDLVECGTHDGQGADVSRMPVALQNLRGDECGGKAEPLTDGRLVLRLQVTEGADGA